MYQVMYQPSPRGGRLAALGSLLALAALVGCSDRASVLPLAEASPTPGYGAGTGARTEADLVRAALLPADLPGYRATPVLSLPQTVADWSTADEGCRPLVASLRETKIVGSSASVEADFQLGNRMVAESLDALPDAAAAQDWVRTFGVDVTACAGGTVRFAELGNHPLRVATASGPDVGDAHAGLRLTATAADGGARLQLIATSVGDVSIGLVFLNESAVTTSRVTTAAVSRVRHALRLPP